MINYSYLALGDSYTIGEQVPFAENFPNQTVQILRRSGLAFYAAEIIAKTGWTTDELSNAIENTTTLENYDIVSLLIGVNNQYRGRSATEFKIEFEHLLQKAIQFSGNRPYRVVVLSIPDWGVTPFAEGRDRKQVAEEIDVYNDICKKSAAAFKANFINITISQRDDGNKTAFLAPDGLHPSGKEYKKWAAELADAILKAL
ncbi:MAG: SGNH/GDSL hydrolase family protein [Chitinophagaceae bacterium]|nr:SGNH/GDSL hydrolase family protein [Chitinophagaceae bacterium]MBK8786587.1 SGNH/GDSL hydrolase family protein [Chitinophagaceae bacterium]MBL0200535.1 SGNH/GDSL hydrolase family protein [Chitinophagaceae bacterium]